MSSYQESLISKINACTSCADLEVVSREMTAIIDKMKADINIEISALTPLMVAVSPLNIYGIVDWINAMRASIQKPLTAWQIKLTEVTTMQSIINSRINQLKSELGCSF